MKTSRQILSFLFMLQAFLMPMHAQESLKWQEIQTVEQVCLAYPDRIHVLMTSLNLELDALADVRSAYQQDKLVLACQHLLEHYQTENHASFLRQDLPSPSRQTNSLADSILQDIFIVQEVAGQSPRQADGHLDWFFQGPKADQEWAWGVNRHYHLRTLFEVFLTTGNPVYAQAMDAHIKDWVLSSLPYPAEKSSTAMWRGLEVSFRVKIWARIFWGLLESEHLSPATRLLLLSSIPEHAHYARNFHAEGNWLTMELSGLAMASIAWPEFTFSSPGLTYAKDKMTESMNRQVYPDGVQTELTSHYHYVALRNFDLFRELCQEAGVGLSTSFLQQIEDMWNYLAYSMRPDGYGIMNNDSDRDENRHRILQAAKQYEREDWQYIASNGREGTFPESGPSIVFPWAGQLIMRDDYNEQAHWAFFDIGPWGTGHQHNDMLHLSLSAYGKDFLVDGGRFAYRGALADKFRGYARSTHSHNALLIDGQGQGKGIKLAEDSLSSQHYRIEEKFDYAWNRVSQFEEIEGSVAHSRSVLYVRGKFWIVTDHVDTDRPREIETMWHWHPACEVSMGPQQMVQGKQETGKLQIIPLGQQAWTINQIRGQEGPQPQGWYSESYNKAEPATVSMYRTNIDAPTTFVWLLVPTAEDASQAKARIKSVKQDHVLVQINHAGEKWDMLIPFTNATKLQVKSK